MREEREHANPASFPLSAKPSVLCVDDSTEILEMLCEVVASEGCEPIRAASCAEAMGILNSGALPNVCLVLSDYNLGGGTGLALRAEAYELRPDLEFCIVSGYITKEMAKRALDLRIRWFFEKPFREEDIAKAVAECRDSWLGKHTAIEEQRNRHIARMRELAADLLQLVHSLRANPQRQDLIQVCAHLVVSAQFHARELGQGPLIKTCNRISSLVLSPAASQRLSQSADPAVVSEFSDLFEGVESLLSSLARSDARAVIDTAGVETLLTRLEASAAKPGRSPVAEQKPTAPESSADNVNSVVKVPLKVLDEFMERAGELTVLRNMVKKLVHSLELRYPGDETLANLVEMLEELHKHTSGMQQQISELRLVSLSEPWKGLTRAVRDLSQKLGKEVDLSLSGGELRIDNSIARILADSLVHLVRNAVDHGIEAPAERLAAGKAARGSLRLEGSREESGICIKIRDDGRGMNEGRISERALQRGLRSAQQLAAMSRDEVLALIFEPGFSTAEVVSDVSGRGVGMDFVRNAVRSVKGSIHIDTQAGRGTTMTLRLPEPKSVQLISALLIEESGSTFAIPQAAIRRLYHLDGERIEKSVIGVGGSEALVTELGTVPIFSLRKALELSAPDAESGCRNFVLLNTEAYLYALEIDSILDEEEVVVKSVPILQKRTGVFLGATFVGVGGLCLILEPDGLAKRMGIDPLSSAEQAAMDALASNERPGYLLCFTLHGTPFSVSLEDVERIEVTYLSQIHQRRGQSYMIYKGEIRQVLASDFLDSTTTPARPLRPLMKTGRPHASAAISQDPNTAVVLVIRSGGQRALLRIGCVIDSDPGDAIITSQWDKPEVLGHLKFEGVYFTVLDLPALLTAAGHFVPPPAPPAPAATPQPEMIPPPDNPLPEEDGIIWVN